ncbi:hypothetical protein TWF694_000251 [Orbilia ellipsospora]|uniref:Uncharacterized protein n=1 Tax=Orbilia ellipsospora TaxID=2528407 RepID=A0AAV9XN17_9PEZI
MEGLSTSSSMTAYSNSIFTNKFISKYSMIDPAIPPIDIYKPDTGSYTQLDPSTAMPAFQVAHVNNKIQLTSTDPRNTKHTIIAYHKKQRIDIRNSPELFPESALLDTIPLEWYSNYSKPNLYDLKLANGKIYRWLNPGQGTGILQLIDKSPDTMGQDMLLAQINVIRNGGVWGKGTLVISVTDAIYSGGTGLTEDIVILSAFGAMKKCEKSFVHSAWYDRKDTVAGNGFMRLVTRGADVLFKTPPIV